MIAWWLAGCAFVTDAELQRRMDADADGHLAIQFGGDDCDDADPAKGPCPDGTPPPVETADTALPTDTGTPGGTGDTGLPVDTGTPPVDTGVPIDTGVPVDTGTVPIDDDADDDGSTDDLDCDDDDPDVHPGAADAPYDGVDSNCDGAPDCDQDEDGHDAEGLGVCTGGDCNDANPAISPDAAENTLTVTIDEDCDGNPVL